MKKHQAHTSSGDSRATPAGESAEHRASALDFLLAETEQLADTGPKDLSGRSRNAGTSPPSQRPTTPPAQRMKVFRFIAPKARSVKLAGDFTNWGKLPLELHRSKDGVWEVSVPLSPGQYGYRFLVDDQWQDDPNCTRRAPNPFGTTNAIAEVG